MTLIGGSQLESKRAVERLQQTVTQNDWVVRMRALASSDLSDVLPRLQTPTLILHPRDYRNLASHEATKLAAGIKSAQFVLIDGSNSFGDAEQGLRAIETFLADLPVVEPASIPASDGLSPRELEVLRLIAAGKSNQQMADELVISLNTVARHVSNIFDKTGCANRTEAASYAHRHRLV